jgi:lysozyme
MLEIVRERFIREEGIRLFPYPDTKGIWTIGIGHNMQVDPNMSGSIDQYKQTGITADQAYALFETDYNKALDNLNQSLPWTQNLDEPRQSVLIDLTFNMGIGGLLEFHNTLHSIQNGNYQDAVNRLKVSSWYGEVGPKRADPLLQILLTGVLT